MEYECIDIVVYGIGCVIGFGIFLLLKRYIIWGYEHEKREREKNRR